MKQKAQKRLTYDEQRIMCKEFLEKFETHDNQEFHDKYNNFKYMIELQKISDEESNCLEILFEDLETYFRNDHELCMVDGFKNNTQKYIQIFTQLANELFPERRKPIEVQNEIRIKFESILRDQRQDNLQGHNELQFTDNEKIPYSTHKNYDVSIVYGPDSKQNVKAISDLKSDQIGSLITLKAIVVRISEIKPEIVVATYACDICGCENYVQVYDNNYKPLDKCMSKKCIENKVSGKLTFLPGLSKFRSYQQIKVQETPDQLKEGRIPRSFTIQLRESNVKKAVPGDIILLQGILLPHRKLGFRQHNTLSFDCYIECLKVRRQKKKYAEMLFTKEQREQIQRVRSNTSEDFLFNQLALSIAPEIFGLETVKKALLLLMAGGITKETHDNLKIRGQINIALIGDPGIAKSQLLKHISYLAPRAIYTTGKGSSGVGLTAAILKDPLTKEIALEAGALVLADMGICCIDEFDKMQESDRTSIHEVMEQQTISIAKAGITTSLNARTSILAAANPLFGRYNKKETPHKNINLPAALLSRFDLVFILLDTPNSQNDFKLASHIGKVHQQQKAPVQDLYSSEFIRNYVAFSKNFEPTISPELHEILIKKYIEKRQEQTNVSKEGQNYTTTRSLLALIRLCQARARLRFSNEVNQSDVIECLEILEQTQKSIGQQEKKPIIDSFAFIYGTIRDLCKYKTSKRVSIDIIRKRIEARGHSEQEMIKTIEEYEGLGVLIRDGDEVVYLDQQK